MGSRTAIRDGIARWPRCVRSGEGAPLQLLGARRQDWGDEAVVIALSSRVMPNDTIVLLFRDGDRRRLGYSCPGVRRADAVGVGDRHRPGMGRDAADGLQLVQRLRDEAAWRRMLRTARWVPSREEPTDEDCASFHASRLDSAKSSLSQVCKVHGARVDERAEHRRLDEAVGNLAGDRRRSRLHRGREIPTLPQRSSSMTDTETTFIGGCVMM